MTDVEVYRWDQMKREALADGLFERVAMRGDQSLVTVNWLSPEMPQQSPHSHPFDQIMIIVHGEGDLIAGDQVIHMPEGSMARIPADMPHTLRLRGDKPVLNIDVFAPAREDYLYLTGYQKFEASTGASREDAA